MSQQESDLIAPQQRYRWMFGKGTGRQMHAIDARGVSRCNAYRAADVVNQIYLRHHRLITMHPSSSTRSEVFTIIPIINMQHHELATAMTRVMTSYICTTFSENLSTWLSPLC
jgi:hypothetical protein